jgi:hypothetical protein
MLDLEQRDDVDPICPHCQESIRTIAFRQLRGVFGRRYVYFCDRCRAVLGVSHRKGFWMG